MVGSGSAGRVRLRGGIGNTAVVKQPGAAQQLDFRAGQGGVEVVGDGEAGQKRGSPSSSLASAWPARSTSAVSALVGGVWPAGPPSLVPPRCLQGRSVPPSLRSVRYSRPFGTASGRPFRCGGPDCRFCPMVAMLVKLDWVPPYGGTHKYPWREHAEDAVFQFALNHRAATTTPTPGDRSATLWRTSPRSLVDW